MKASRAHVKIGADEFMLDESIDASSNAVGGSLFRPHYKHSFQNVFEGRTPILTGAPEEDEIRPERLVWSFSDWSGGEGMRTFANDLPNVYDFSYGENTRIRGQITGRPNRTEHEETSEDYTHYGGFTVGQSNLWLGQDRRMYYNSDGASGSWHSKTLAQMKLDNSGSSVNGADSTSYYITAVAGDSKYAYYAVWRESNGHRAVLRVQDSGNAEILVADAAVDNPYKGMTVMHGRLYGWTGENLIRHDLWGSLPLDADHRGSVSNKTVNSIPFAGTHWADCVASENAVYAFSSTHGYTILYQYKFNGGFGPIWAGPEGFNVKSICYQNGTIFMAGHWGGDASAGAGKGALMSYRTDTREDKFVGWFRKQNNLNLQMQEMAPSYGSQILVAAAWTGRIFVYDADTDGITCLDDIATSGSGGAEANAPRIPATDGFTHTEGTDKVLGVHTFGQYRIVAQYAPQRTPGSGAIRFLHYEDDEPAQRQASTTVNDAVTTLEVGDNDFGLAFEQKILLGFEVLFRPLTTGQSFGLQYSVDGGSFSTVQTVDSSSSDAAKGRTYIAVSTTSSTQKFSRFRWRLTLTGARTGGSNYMPPIIYNVTAECNLIAYDETWDLILRMKDEQPLTRPTNRQLRGSNARDRLFASKTLKKVLSFQDGYRYRFVPGPPQYTTHSVIIDSIEDIITLNGEGACKVRLRAIPT